MWILRGIGVRWLQFGIFAGGMYVLVSVLRPEHGSTLAIGLGIALMLICGMALRALRGRDADD